MRYGFSSVLAFSVRACDAFVCWCLSHVASSGFGESGSGGRVSGGFRAGEFVSADEGVWSSTLLGDLVVGVVWVLSPVALCLSVESWSNKLISMLDLLSWRVFLRNGDGPLCSASLLRGRRLKILSSRASI